MEHKENSTWKAEPISLLLMDLNCKPVHTCAYTVPRSVKQQSRKEIVSLVDIGVHEEAYFSEWASSIPIFAIPEKIRALKIRVITDFRKNITQLIVET
jgi:hypothetical protein